MASIQLTGIAADGETLTIPMEMMTDKASLPSEGTMQFHDKIVFDASDPSFRILPDSGYLVATPRVARTGIQLYRGFEVGKKDMDIVRVYRPESSVFDKQSMQTFAYKPITDDHPPEQVTADNWKKYSFGNAGPDIKRDGIFVRVPMTVMDNAVIKKVQDGKAELSVGYSCDLKWEAGVDPQGQAYDAVQTNIRVNHIAIVDAARGGGKLRIGDKTETHDAPNADSAASNDGEIEMTDVTKPAVTLVTMDVDGIQCQMSDTSSQIVKRHIKGLMDSVASVQAALDAEKSAHSKLQTDHATKVTELTKTVEAKDAEIATLKKQLEDAKVTPAQIDQFVRDRAAIIGKAKVVLGDKLVVDGKTDAEIRRQVVDSKLGETAKGWNDDLVKASFDTLTAGIKEGQNGAPVQDQARAFVPGAHVQDSSDMYDKADKKLSERWKGAAA